MFLTAFFVIGRPYRVVGRSMEPALLAGDWVLLRERPPHDGDVIVFREPDSGLLAVKRVAGEPGESVQIVGGDLWTQGAPRARALHGVEDLVPMLEADGPAIAEHMDLAQAGFTATEEQWELPDGEALAYLRTPPFAHYLLRGELVRGEVPAVDLGLELEFTLGSERAEVTIELRVSRASFRARLLEGGGRVRVERHEPDQPLELLLDQVLAPPVTGGRLFFAAVNRTLTLALEDRVLLDGLPFRPPVPAIFADRPPDFAHFSHAGIGGRGPLSIRRIRVGRDVLLDSTGTFGGAEVFHLGPEEYFLLGDNPAHSRDSRHYGAVDRSSILGVVRTRWGGWNWTERGWRRD